MAVFVKNPESFADFFLDVAVMYLPVFIWSRKKGILSKFDATNQHNSVLERNFRGNHLPIYSHRYI